MIHYYLKIDNYTSSENTGAGSTTKCKREERSLSISLSISYEQYHKRTLELKEKWTEQSSSIQSIEGWTSSNHKNYGSTVNCIDKVKSRDQKKLNCRLKDPAMLAFHSSWMMEPMRICEWNLAKIQILNSLAKEQEVKMWNLFLRKEANHKSTSRMIWTALDQFEYKITKFLILNGKMQTSNI